MSWRSGWFVDCAPKSLICVSRGASLPAGTYYWEVKMDRGGFVYIVWGIAIGVCTASAQLAYIVDAEVNSAQAASQYANFVTITVDGVGVAAPSWGYPNRPVAGPHYAIADDGQTYAIAINTTTHRMWWRNNTGADTRWNLSAPADPATGVGGFDISASGDSPMVGPLYPMVGATRGATTNAAYDTTSKGTINFGGSAFVGTPPTGFISPYSLLGAQCKLDPNANGGVILSNNNLTFEGTLPTGVPNQGNPYFCVRANFSITQA